MAPSLSSASCEAPSLSSSVTSSTDLGWRDVENVARRGVAVSSGLTAAYDQLSLTTFEIKKRTKQNKRPSSQVFFQNTTRQQDARENDPEVWRGRRGDGGVGGAPFIPRCGLSGPCSNLGMSEPERRENT